MDLRDGNIIGAIGENIQSHIVQLWDSISVGQQTHGGVGYGELPGEQRGDILMRGAVQTG